jgi:hypothetical protein
MKTLRLFSALLGLTAAFALRAADTPNSSSRVAVIFDHPENFTDVKDSEPPTDRGQEAILTSIRNYLVMRASPMIPEGEKLTMTFSDIDLAGKYEPWRGPQWSGVRIVKDVYPPSFKFTYQVTDSSGKVVKGGNESIRDGAFQFRTVLDPSEPLHYEKAFLNDWVHSTLVGLK